MITSIIKSDAEKASRNSSPFCSDNVLKTYLPALLEVAFLPYVFHNSLDLIDRISISTVYIL